MYAFVFRSMELLLASFSALASTLHSTPCTFPRIRCSHSYNYVVACGPAKSANWKLWLFLLFLCFTLFELLCTFFCTFLLPHASAVAGSGQSHLPRMNVDASVLEAVNLRYSNCVKCTSSLSSASLFPIGELAFHSLANLTISLLRSPWRNCCCHWPLVQPSLSLEPLARPCPISRSP